MQHVIKSEYLKRLVGGRGHTHRTMEYFKKCTFTCHLITMQFKKILVLLSIIAILPIYLPAQTADGIIKRYVTFIGGKKNWSKVKTLTTSGE